MIIATARSFNEHRNIEQYCRAYQWADKILIADGGSTDDTKELALKYPKVEVRDYLNTVQLPNGKFRNPDGPHIQFLVDWATEIGGTWIIHQDVDQRPNKFLKNDVCGILNNSTDDFVVVTQIFTYGGINYYFKDLSHAGGDWMQGLWAWRLSKNLKIIDKMPHYEFSYDGEHSIDINQQPRVLRLLPPYCFMHFGWEDEAVTQEHVRYYNETKLIPGMEHPLKWAGKLVPCENWMIE